MHAPGLPLAEQVGHLWWFLTDLYPRTGGQEVLRTPDFVKR